jgi:Sec-independent protein translocase protein TatA
MNLGFSGEMIFLFLLVLILFGPKKMPEIARQVARLLNEFRRASYEFRSQIESEVNSLDVSGKAGSGGNPRQQILPSFQAPLGSLANRIFNPPSPEKLEAIEEANAEAAAVNAAAAESVASKAAAEPVLVTEPSPAPKVAPDA